MSAATKARHHARVARRKRLRRLRVVVIETPVRVVRGSAAPCVLCGEERSFCGFAVLVGSSALCAGCASGVDSRTPSLLRRAVRLDHRARWEEQGGPAPGRHWPKTLIGHYEPAWFE